MPGINGEPAKLTYTIREHQDDRLGEAPGSAVIQFGPRDLPNGKRLAGRKVTLNSMHIVGLEKSTRLEPRVRPSAAMLTNPEKASVDALKQQHGVDVAPVKP